MTSLTSRAPAQWLNNAVHQPSDAKPDLEALEEILKTPDNRDRANLLYFAGRYFQLHGKQDLTRQYWQRCVETEGAKSKWNYTVASAQLRELTAEKTEPEKQK